MGNLQSATNLYKGATQKYIKTRKERIEIFTEQSVTLVVKKKAILFCPGGAILQTKTSVGGYLLSQITSIADLAENVASAIESIYKNKKSTLVEDVNKLLGGTYFSSYDEILSEINSAIRKINVNKINSEVSITGLATLQNLKITIESDSITFAQGVCDLSQITVSKLYISILTCSLMASVENDDSNPLGIRKLASLIHSNSKIKNTGGVVSRVVKIEEGLVVGAIFVVLLVLLISITLMIVSGEKTRRTFQV